MKQLYSIIICLCTIYSFSYGQLPDPITHNINYFGTITSDYGQRHYPSSPFHNGIDYRCLLGDKAYAVDGGDIVKFGEWGNWKSYIRINSDGLERRYMHVESKSYIFGEDLVWEYCPNCIDARAKNDNFIILRHIVNNDLRTHSVLTTTAYEGPDTYYDDYTGDEVPIISHIERSNWIFMPGNYPNEIDPHLHIGRNFGVRINPLQFIAHDGDDDPTIEMPAIKRVQNNEAVTFQPDNIIFGLPVILEAKVNTTVEMDLNEFSVYCLDDGNELAFNKSWRIADYGNSKNNIANSDIILTYPMTNEGWIQDHITEAVYPYDPVDQNNNGNADPGHDYFKLHWPSKKSAVEEQAEAWVNDRAVYPDGDYTVTFRAEDIGGNFAPETESIVLDNHKPYVQEISIYSGNKIYRAVIGYNDPTGATDKGKLVFSLDEQTLNDCGDFENNLEFYITTSEAMQSVTIKIPDAGTSGYDLVLENYSEDHRKWKGVISRYQLPLFFEFDNHYSLVIAGRDKADNEIINLGMSENGEEISASWLPYRDNNGNWVNTVGTGERGHNLYFCPSNWIKANYNARIEDQKIAPREENMLYGNSPLDIEFTDASTGEPVEWNWDFGDNSLPVTEQNTTHTFINNTNEPVQYNVSLKACNEGGCDIEVKNKLITVYPEGYANIPIADFTYTQETYTGPYVIQFQNYSVGNINTYLWSMGDGSTYAQPEPIHEYSAPGKYIVKLILNDEVSEQMEIEVLKASSNFAPFDFKWTCIANTDNMNSGEGLTGELINFESTDHFWESFYEWDMGDGSPHYYTSHADHAYMNTGTYAVTLIIRNFEGELIGHKTKWVTVVANTLVIPPEANEIQFPNAAFIKDMEIENNEFFVTCCADNNEILVYEFNGIQWILKSTIPTTGDCYSNITISGDKMLVGEYFNSNSNKGRVHFYKKVNGVWTKQTQILQDTEYNSFKFFGESISMDNDWVMIHSEGISSGEKISFWQFNESTNRWTCNPNNNKYYYLDNKSSIAHVKLIDNNALWDYTYYVLNDGLWEFAWNPVIVESGSLDSHDPLSETVSFSKSLLFSGRQGTLFRYIIEEDNSLYLLPYYSVPNNISINFASSLDVFNNYLVCGNNGDINGSSQIGKRGSAFLYRNDESGNLSLFRTYYPNNGIEDDNYGAGVRANQDHILIASRGVDNDEYYKAPSIYYYNDYAYFGDKEITIPNFSKYNLKKEEPTRFAARTIDVGGGKGTAAVTGGENIELIGQTVTLKPGFSVTSGGVLRGSGTICEDYISKPEIKIENSNEFNLGLNSLPEPELSSQKDDGFTIMPNPSTDHFIIVSNNPDEMIDQIILTDSFGKKIKTQKNDQQQNQVKLSMQNCASGLYFVTIISDHKITTKKAIKL
jgi:PKD repeat protein